MKKILNALFCLCLSFTAHAASQVAGVSFEPTATVSGQSLVLNGAGVRQKFFFDVYAAGLYLGAPAKNAAQALSADTPKRIDLTMLRDVSAKKFVASLNEGLKANQDVASLATLQDRIDRFTTTLLGLGEAKKGQRFQMDYAPGSGTQLRVDGQRVGNPIEGADFYNALLSIWIGEHPAQTDLKSALLGH